MSPLPARFWDKVTEDPATGCWDWTGAIARNGYGQFAHEGTTKSTHRLAWQEFNGEVPRGLMLDHLCRNRACVNPLHMDVVTALVNFHRGVADVVRRGRRVATHPDRCIRGHALAGPNLRLHRRGALPTVRNCRACYVLDRRAKSTALRRKPRLDVDAVLAAAEAALAERGNR